MFVHHVLMNFHFIFLWCVEIAKGTIKFASLVYIFHMAVQLSNGLSFKLTIITRYNEIQMNFNVFLQVPDVWSCIGTVSFRTGIFDAAMNSPFVLLHFTLVFEHFITMLTKVNNLIVFFQHVRLQRFPFPTFVLAVFALQPVGEYFWLL